MVDDRQAERMEELAAELLERWAGAATVIQRVARYGAPRLEARTSEELVAEEDAAVAAAAEHEAAVAAADAAAAAAAEGPVTAEELRARGAEARAAALAADLEEVMASGEVHFQLLPEADRRMIYENFGPIRAEVAQAQAEARAARAAATAAAAAQAQAVEVAAAEAAVAATAEGRSVNRRRRRARA